MEAVRYRLAGSCLDKNTDSPDLTAALDWDRDTALADSPDSTVALDWGKDTGLAAAD